MNERLETFYKENLNILKDHGYYNPHDKTDTFSDINRHS